MRREEIRPGLAADARHTTGELANSLGMSAPRSPAAWRCCARPAC
ncbi:hypothetical protein ACWGIB_13130 [Streptomyces xiamenensis]